MSIVANPGAVVLLTWQSKLGETNLFPQAVIKDDSGNTKATVNLTHDSNGAYTGTTALLNSEGIYRVQYIAFVDSGHTTQSGVDEIISESISIQHSWRPSFGGGGEVVIPKEILDPIVKGMKLLAEEMMKIKAELDKKSEFNPNKDMVKTDIQPTSMRPIMEKIDNIPNKITIARQ